MKSLLYLKLLKPFQGAVRDLGKNEDEQADILFFFFSPYYRENPALLNSSPCVLMMLCTCDMDPRQNLGILQWSRWRAAPSSQSSLQMSPWGEGGGRLTAGKQAHFLWAGEGVGPESEAQPLHQFWDQASNWLILGLRFLPGRKYIQ